MEQTFATTLMIAIKAIPKTAGTKVNNKKKAPNLRSELLEKVAMTYSPTNICSTIGAVGLNFSVRDGKRWDPNAINRLNKGPIICRTTHSQCI